MAIAQPTDECRGGRSDHRSARVRAVQFGGVPGRRCGSAGSHAEGRVPQGARGGDGGAQPDGDGLSAQATTLPARIRSRARGADLRRVSEQPRLREARQDRRWPGCHGTVARRRAAQHLGGQHPLGSGCASRLGLLQGGGDGAHRSSA